MGKFDSVTEKYRLSGVSEDNIEFAISAVKDGTKREHILESLTADYRGMTEPKAVALLEDLFEANGGEFKKQNQYGYFYGIVFLLVGLACAVYIYAVFTYGGVIVFPKFVFAGAGLGIAFGCFYLYKAMRGKFRDDNEPFRTHR